MGKIRLTCVSVLFYVIIFISCFLAESFAFYSDNPLGGFDVFTSLIISFIIIQLLALFYYFEHKKNGLRFDRILLPILSICFLLMSVTILWQNNLPGIDKYNIVIQLFIWMIVLYTILFVNNRYNIVKKVSTIFAFTYLVFILICAVIDLFVEGHSLEAIFNDTYSEGGFRFIIYNSNVWGMMLLFGQLTAYLLSIKKFNIIYYISSIVLFLFNVMTTCSTTVFIGGTLLIIYTIYEIVYMFKSSKKASIALLGAFFGTIALIAVIFTILYQSHVTWFVNFWDFLFSHTFVKDYSTFTHRTFIWEKIFKLLLENPRDFIFGLGYRNADKFLESVAGVRSAHNGYIEMLLRHGILGLLIYLGALGLYVYSLILLIKKKQYRFVFINGLLFLCVLVHACMESTTFFTPNIQGSYLTLAFYLPVVNIMQNKHFEMLKEETTQLKRDTI